MVLPRYALGQGLTIGAWEGDYILLLAEDGGQAADLSAKGRPDVLRIVRHKILDAAHDVVEERGTVDESTEARDLTGNGSADLGLVVLEKLDKRRDQVPRDDLIVDGLCNLVRETNGQYRVPEACSRRPIPFRIYRQSCTGLSSSCPLSGYAATLAEHHGWTAAPLVRPRQWR